MFKLLSLPIILSAVTVLGAMAPSSHAAANDSVSFTTTSQALPYGEQITIASKALQVDHRIDVYLPQNYDKHTSIDYPVIYTLDGWTLSQSVSGVVSHMGNTAAMPKAIVVALHTPNVWRYLPKLDTKDSGWNINNTAHENQPYLNFIKQELIPYVDKNYRTNNYRVLIGMSPTAIIALDSFIKAPELFNAHYLFAAVDIFALGYDEKSTLLDSLVTNIKANPQLKRSLYIASAQSDFEENESHAANAKRLQKLVSPLMKNRFKLEYLPNTEHYSMAIPALVSALKLNFPRNELEIFRDLIAKPGNALKNIEAHYRDLSKKYGFTIYPEPDLNRNVNSFRGIGYVLLGAKRHQEAMEIFKRWTELSPNEANAFDSLADAYESLGKNELALQAHLQAVSVAKKLKDPRLAFFKQTLKSFEERRAKHSS